MRTPTRTVRAMLMATAAFTLLGSVVLAQPRNHKPDPKHQAARQQLRQTMIDWARTAILPTVTTWKNQLDAAMSAEDLAALNALRARAAKLRKEAISHLNNMQQAWQSEDYTALKHHREALKGMREQRDALFSELKPLAIKYRETLQQIGKVAQPQVQQWRQEGKKKVEEWIAAHSNELGDRPFGMHGMPWKGWGKMLGFDGKMQKKAAVVRFMLWNGEDITQDLPKLAPNGSVDEGFDLK